jgi:hypothetical protein
MVEAGGEALVMGILTILYIMVSDFIVYLLPAIIATLVFYFSNTKTLTNKILSVILSIISFVLSLFILESFYPIDKSWIHYSYLKPFSVFMFMLSFIIIMLLKMRRGDNKWSGRQH